MDALPVGKHFLVKDLGRIIMLFMTKVAMLVFHAVTVGSLKVVEQITEDI